MSFMQTTLFFVPRLLIVMIMIGFTAGMALAADSTDPNDYFFYDDAEGGDINEFWVLGTNPPSYNDTYAKDGTYSIKMIEHATDTPDSYINQSEFTQDEAREPYCMSYDFYYPTAASSDAENMGFLFGLNSTSAHWDDCAITLNGYLAAGGGGGFSTVSCLDGTDWGVLEASRTGVWMHHTLCVEDGYSHSGGSTYMWVFNDTGNLYINGTSGFDRGDLEHIVYQGYGQGASGKTLYVDNIRIWNRTAYGETPPQEAAPDPAAGLQRERMWTQIIDTNTTINNPSYEDILLSTVTIPTNTEGYVKSTINLFSAGSSTTFCRITVNDTDYSSEASRTNTANQYGSMYLITGNITLDAGDYAVALECRRQGGGSYVVTGGELIGVTNNVSLNFKDHNSLTVTNGFTNLTQDTILTTNATNNATNPLYIIADYAATYDYTTAGTIETILEFNNENCTIMPRYGGAGASGSIGGNCFFQVTNETNYTYTIHGQGDGTVDYSLILKETVLQVGEINSTSLTGDTVTTSHAYISGVNITTSDALGGIHILAGIPTNGTGNVTYQLRLSDGTSDESTNMTRTISGTTGVSIIQSYFQGLAADTYGAELWGVCDDTSCDIEGGDLLAYTAENLTITLDGFTINATDSYDNSQITTFTVTYNDITFTTENGTIFIPTSEDTANFTADTGNYFTHTETDHNASNNIQIDFIEALLTVSITDSQGDTPTDQFTITNGLYSNTSASPITIGATNGSNSVAALNLSWYNETNQTCTATAGATTAGCDFTVYNTYIYWQTDVELTAVYPVCTLNGTTLVQTNGFSTLLPNQNNTLLCAEGEQYAAFNATFEHLNTPTNFTYNVTEYQLILNFSMETTGDVAWGTGFNLSWTESQFIRILHDLPEGIMEVEFNQDSTCASGVNCTQQYYEFYNDVTEVETAVLWVWNESLGTSAYIWVPDFGNNPIEGATVTLYRANSTSNEYEMVGQRLTDQEGFVYFYMPFDEILRVVVTKDTYSAATFEHWDTNDLYDVAADDPIVMPLGRNSLNNYMGNLILTSGSYDNNTHYLGMRVINPKEPDLYWLTTEEGTFRKLTWSGGEATETLTSNIQGGTHFTHGTNVTITILEPWSNVTAFLALTELQRYQQSDTIFNKTIEFHNIQRQNILTNVPDNKWTAGLYLIILILFSGMMNVLIQGYGLHAFLIGSLLATFFSSTLVALPFAALFYYVFRKVFGITEHD